MLKQNIFKLRYKKYLADITSKRLKILMPVAIILLISLILSDIYLRNSISAVYTRIPPLVYAIFLYICNQLFKRCKVSKITLYNIFLVLLPTMMFAKFFIHFGDGTNSVNVTSIIISIFIISIEVKANKFNSVLIFFLPPFIFFIFLFAFYPVTNQDSVPLINIVIILIVGFFINSVQNKFRYNTFLSNYLLNVEKKKLEDTLFELNNYKDKLEEKVAEKTVDLKQALDKAKESDLLKTQFLLNISHELRTPMNAVLGFSEIISRKNPELKKEVTIIKDNLNLLLNTIDNILLLSKLQTEKIGLEISKFKLSELNTRIQNIITKKLEESNKDIRLKFENLNNNDIIFNSDFLKIVEIFNQLTDNAVKYTEKGEIKVSCMLSTENNIQYIVSDTGIGIDNDELHNIFDPFRKHEHTEKLFGGTGIGLSIVKKISDLLNSTVTIKSTLKKGTTAIINLKINL